MANSEKDIVIRPRKGDSSLNPVIEFVSADASTAGKTLTFEVSPEDSGVIKVLGETNGEIFRFGDGSVNQFNMKGNMLFSDSAKLKFGNSGDLEIYHDASNSYIDEVGTGYLQIRTNGAGITIGATDGKAMFSGINNGNSIIHYAGNEKLRTISTGIDVTGTLTATGNIASGDSSGGVALTINDGYGNANVTWNHENGVPEQNGNSARIEVNTDSTTGALMMFELKSGVTSGTAVALDNILTLSETSVTTYEDFLPNSNNTVNIGSSSLRFNTIYATTFNGTVTNANALDNIDSTSFLRSDTSDTYSGGVLQVNNTAGQSILTSGGINGLRIYQPTANADALMSFHVNGDYAVHFGLDGGSNDLYVGGWSMGATNRYKIHHDGNTTIGNGTLTVAAGSAITVSSPNTFTANQTGNTTITVNHADTSSQASVDNSGNTVIQDVTLDTYGHVTGLTSKALSIPAAANNATITITAGNALTGGGSFTTDQSTNETITINHQDTSAASSANNSGNTFIQDVTLDTYGHVTGLTSAAVSIGNATITISAGNALTGGGTFTTNQTSNGTITINHQDTSAASSVNNSGNTVIQDVTLDTYGHVTGLTSTTLSIPSAANNATITISAGSALTGGGSFTTNQGTNETITINHQDTSAASSANNSGNTFIQDVTLDTYGHVTGLTSAAVSIGNANIILGAGPGMTLGSGGAFTTNQSSGQSITYSVGAGNGISVGTYAVAMSGSYTGNFTATGNITAYSDARLKEDIETLDGSKVYDMRGVSFKRDGERGVGVLAQEMLDVEPSVVLEREDMEYLSVNYGALAGYFIEALKEQKKIIDELAAKVKKLESKK